MKKSKRYFAKRLYYKHHSMLVPKTRGDGTQEIDTKKIENELDRRVTTCSKDDVTKGDNQTILGSKRFADDLQLVDTVPLYTGYIPTDIAHSTGDHTVKTHEGTWPSLSVFTRNKLVTEDPTQIPGRESYSGMAVTTSEFSGLGEKKMLEKSRAGLIFSSTKTDTVWSTSASLTTTSATVRIDNDASIDLCKRSSFTTVPMDVVVEKCENQGVLRILTLLIEATKESSTLLNRLFGDTFNDFSAGSVEHLPNPRVYQGKTQAANSGTENLFTYLTEWLGRPISTWPSYILSYIDYNGGAVPNTKAMLRELSDTLNKSKERLYKALVYYTCFAVIYIGKDYKVFSSASSSDTRFWSSPVKYNEITDCLFGNGSISDSITRETVQRSFPALRLLTRNDWTDIMVKVESIMDFTTLDELFTLSSSSLKEVYINPYLSEHGLTGSTIQDLYFYFTSQLGLDDILMRNLKDSEYVKPTYVFTLAHLIERAEPHTAVSESFKGERWALTFTALGADKLQDLEDSGQQQKNDILTYLLKTLITGESQYVSTEIGVTLGTSKTQKDVASLKPIYNTTSSTDPSNAVILGEGSNQFLSVYGRNLPVFSGHFKHGYYTDEDANWKYHRYRCLQSNSNSGSRVTMNLVNTNVLNSIELTPGYGEALNDHGEIVNEHNEIYPYLLNLPPVEDNEVWNAEIRYTFPTDIWDGIMRRLKVRHDYLGDVTDAKVSDLRAVTTNLFNEDRSYIVGNHNGQSGLFTGTYYLQTLMHIPPVISFLGYYGNRRYLNEAGNMYIEPERKSAVFAPIIHPMHHPITHLTLKDAFVKGSLKWKFPNDDELLRDLSSDEIEGGNYFHVEIFLINRSHKLDKYRPGAWEAAYPICKSVFPYFYLGGQGESVPEKV